MKVDDRYEEYFAKFLVEDLLSYGKFIKRECPDLQGYNDVGIEVTTANLPGLDEVMGDMQKLGREVNGKFEVCEKKLKKLQGVSEDYMYGARMYVTIGSIFDSPMPIVSMSGDLFHALFPVIGYQFEKKIKKLNSGNYHIFSKMGIFMFSNIVLYGNNIDSKCKELLDMFRRKQQMIKSDNFGFSHFYDFVCIYSVSDAVFVHIDLVSGKIDTSYDVDVCKYNNCVRMFFNNDV